MKTRLWKEARPLLPYGLGVLLMSVLVQLSGANNISAWQSAELMSWDGSFLFHAFGFVVALAGSVVFGVEASSQTLPLLMVQPLSRSRLWLEKMGLYWALLIAAGTLLIFQPWWSLNYRGVSYSGMEWLTVLGVVGLGVPFWTQIAGTALGGAALGMAIGFILGVPVPMVLRHLLHLRDLPAPEITSTLDLYAKTVFPSYCLLVVMGSYWRFLRFQALGNRGEGWTGFLTSLRLERLAWMRPSAHQTLNLIRKELVLQRISWLLAGGMVLVWVLFLIAIRAIDSIALNYGALLLEKNRVSPDVFKLGAAEFIGPLVIYCLIIPLIVGATAVAEERSLGTYTTAITQPASARTQWLVKAGVSLVISFFLGVLLPLFASLLSSEARQTLVEASSGSWVSSAALMLALQPTLTLVALWASAVCATTLRAAGLALGVSAALAAWFGFSMSVSEVFARTALSEIAESVLVQGLLGGSLVLFLAVAVVLLMLGLSMLGYHGFRRLEQIRWHHLAGFGGVCAWILLSAQVVAILMHAFNYRH